ncbi:MAG: hypothetical protein KatS3mg052_0241 [Candidatus Roseilinea sp.]|nr:MAG: hypothetical protein KatS3mg052_0241 [Candidatus Roseilinea sp.]
MTRATPDSPAPVPPASAECPVLPPEAQVRAGDRLFGGSLAFVALRCTLRYIVLPFLLPLVGLASTLSATIALVVDAIALITIALNVRRLWHTNWRWRYMGLAVGMTVIIGILAWRDLQIVFGR